MAYKVICYHHRKAIRKGDVEAETITDSCEVFKSKKDVVSYLTKKESEAKRRGYKARMGGNKRGEMPELVIYTNNTWVHENTGEKEQEYYWYRTEKV